MHWMMALQGQTEQLAEGSNMLLAYGPLGVYAIGATAAIVVLYRQGLKREDDLKALVATTVEQITISNEQNAAVVKHLENLK